MKKINQKIITNCFLCIFAVMVLMLCGNSTKAASKEELKRIWYETNNYPIAVGDEGWYDYGMMDIFDILNPPQELLESYSSAKLAELMMTYPYLWVLPSYEINNIEYFFGYVQHCDIYKELMDRENGIKSILLAYRNSDISLGLLNSDPYVVWMLNTEVNAEIFGCQFIKHFIDIFDAEEQELANAIIAEKEQLYNDLVYSDTKRYLSFSDEQDSGNRAIVELIHQLNNRDGFTVTGSAFLKSIEGVNIEFVSGVYNKYGVNSSCLHWTNYDYTPQKRTQLDNSIAYSWIMIDHSTPKYNCHSYAWIMSNNANTYWLDLPTTYMGSSQITSLGFNVTPQIGDMIVYYDQSNSITHSAKVVSTPQGKTGIYVRSKISGRALYDSPLDEVGIYHNNSQNYAVYRW